MLTYVSKMLNLLAWFECIQKTVYCSFINVHTKIKVKCSQIHLEGTLISLVFRDTLVKTFMNHPRFHSGPNPSNSQPLC